MKYATFRRRGSVQVGVVVGEAVQPVQGAGASPGLRGLIAAERLMSPHPAGEPFGLDEIELLPPVTDAGKILCVGLNYPDHAAEAGAELPRHPAIFARFSDSLVGHRQPIIQPSISTQFDFEGELAVIIGRTARYVALEAALDHVAGYTIFADNSLRDLQAHSQTGMSGKISPRSGSVGPWMVTRDEISDPNDLELKTWLNGVQMQHGCTADMIFSVPALVSYLSTVTQLEPGDMIATGTPKGVGWRRRPPVWMKPGDRLEIDIKGLGRLANTVAREGVS